VHQSHEEDAFRNLKAFGSRLPKETVCRGIGFWSVAMCTGVSSQANSASTCRQAPQGNAGVLPSATTAIAARRLAPAAMAADTALRSAQMVRPYEAFSTLHPVKTLPSSEATAAPTRNSE
jgi:hypothetical protein